VSFIAIFSVLDIVCREAVASFFYPSVNAIVEAVHAQKVQADVPINVMSFSVIVTTAHYFGLKTIILVGGFAASDWLFSKLRQSLSPNEVTFFRPDRHVYDTSY
jgi:hypothetical protein